MSPNADRDGPRRGLALALGRNWAPLLVAAVAVLVAVQRDVNGRPVPLPIAVYAALVASVVLAVQGYGGTRRAVDAGRMAQSLTWDGFVRPYRQPEQPGDLYTAMAARMRQTDAYLRTVAGQYGLESITVATGSRLGGYRDASSSRVGTRAHLWLGLHWFHPEATHHLLPVLEHELAHVRRRDTRRRLVRDPLAAAAIVLAAGRLPHLTAALAALAILAWLTAAHWWDELACDIHAVRACGRDPVAEMWAADLSAAARQPLLTRTWHGLLALRTHPPDRLRRVWARHARLGRTAPDLRHPLAVPQPATRQSRPAVHTAAAASCPPGPAAAPPEGEALAAADGAEGR